MFRLPHTDSYATLFHKAVISVTKFVFHNCLEKKAVILSPCEIKT